MENLVWLNATWQYLCMSKLAADEDGTDAEFVDSYEELLNWFMKLANQADRLMVMLDTGSVKKRRRSCFPCGSTRHVHVGEGESNGR